MAKKRNTNRFAQMHPYEVMIIKEEEMNTNSTVDDRERRNDLRCSFCRPNKGENQKNHRKHGKGKPKYKNKR